MNSGMTGERASALARVADAIGSPQEGDRIWYRRTGETFVHSGYVAERRARLIRVTRSGWSSSEYSSGTGGVWLVLAEVEVLDREQGAALRRPTT